MTNITGVTTLARGAAQVVTMSLGELDGSPVNKEMLESAIAYMLGTTAYFISANGLDVENVTARQEAVYNELMARMGASLPNTAPPVPPTPAQDLQARAAALAEDGRGWPIYMDFGNMRYELWEGMAMSRPRDAVSSSYGYDQLALLLVTAGPDATEEAYASMR